MGKEFLSLSAHTPLCFSSLCFSNLKHSRFLPTAQLQVPVLPRVLQAMGTPVLLQALVTGSSWDVSCRAETHRLAGRPPFLWLLLVRVYPQTVRKFPHEDSRLQLPPSQGKFILKLSVQGPAAENPASFETLASSWLLPAGPFRVQVSSS